MSGAAAVVRNLALQFTRDEMVVAGELPADGQPADWGSGSPELVYVTRAWPATRRGARWWRLLQVPLLVLRCLRLARRHRCTAIVVVYPKADFLLAAYLTAAWTGAKLFPYFHNTYVENCEGMARRVAAWLQGRVFRAAAHVFVMSEGMVELYRERYPGLRCSALLHSFNEDIPVFAPPPPPASPVRLMLSGNINESCRDATARVCEAVARCDDTSLTILSATPRVVLERLRLLSESVHHETPLELLPRLRQADILVLPHGLTGGYAPEEYRTIFPTRTIEYLLAGRPILAHLPADCYLARFLRENDCALLVHEARVESVVQGILRLRSDSELRSRLVRNALRAAEPFQAPRIAATLRAHLQGADASRPHPDHWGARAVMARERREV
jgi:glycosyltransferase involved in cell wall biosynthesis